MPTVPANPFGPWLPWQATCHTVNCCDASSGHAVASVAFCDNAGRAAFIARACNAHDDMLAALKGLVGALTQAYGPMSDEVAERVGELAAEPWRAALKAIAKAEAQS